MTVPAETTDLIAFIEASPTPWHCVDEAVRRLEAAGYERVDERAPSWPRDAGAKLFTIRGGGSLLAWRVGSEPAADAGFRVVCAHTDSPNLRIKPRPDRHKVGYASLGVETYGGVLAATWTDRDLGVAGRVSLAGPDSTIETVLVRVDQPVCRIPNLAIHLNRELSTDGLKLNAQEHLPAVWALTDEPEPGAFTAWIAEKVGADADRVLGWDLCLFDVVPPAIGGRDDAFVFAPRLDNQASCHAALCALIESQDDDPSPATAVVALFDHEEIGSRTSRGAMSSLMRDVLSRIAGDGPAALQRAIASSFLVSADMAHGVHPAYADKHDAEHRPLLGGGPVLKTHTEWRYATDAEASATWRSICRDVDVPLQEFVSRTDLRCGSTVGPIVSAELGMAGVDVGGAMWSMHSIRETCSSADQPLMIRAMRRHLSRGG